MPYTENFNDAAFSRTAGSRESDADQVYGMMSAHLQDVVKRAFAEFPLDEPLSANNRWSMICEALTKAEKAITPFVSLNRNDQAAIDIEGEALIDANIDYRKDAVAQQAGAILFVYRAAIDRLEEQANG